MTTHASMMATQEKTWSYTKWATYDDFIPIVIEMYGCFHFAFWFIFDRLCTYHYHRLSLVFFNPFNSCFLLSTLLVHSLVMCASHIESSTCYCIWLGFLISSTHHSYCTCIISWFVIDDNSFVIGRFFLLLLIFIL